MATIETNEYLSTAEAAHRIGGIDAETVRRYCANYDEGKTPAIEALLMGRSWFIHRDIVKQFKTERNSVGRPRSE